MIDRTFSIVNLCGRIRSNLVTLRLNLQQNSQTPQHRKSVQTEPVEPADVETEPTTEQTCIKPKKFVSAAGLSPLPHCETRTMKLGIHSKRSGDGAIVLTSSPYLEKLHLRQSQKELKTRKCTKAKRIIGLPNQPVQKKEKASKSYNIRCLKQW